MTRIAIIVSTGDSRVDSLLRGVMGKLSKTGAFEPIDEFKNIPVISGMTPELMSAMVDPSSGTPGIVELDIDDINLSAFKALMAGKLLTGWERSYASVMDRAPAGLAGAALAGELAKVRAGCEACTNVFQGPAPLICVSRPFANVECEDDYDDGEFDFSITRQLRASDVLQSATSKWVAFDSTLEPAVDGPFTFQASAGTRVQNESHASGVAALQLPYHGDSEGLASILNQLPREVAGMLYGRNHSENDSDTMKTGFVVIAFHEPRPVTADVSAPGDGQAAVVQEGGVAQVAMATDLGNGATAVLAVQLGGDSIQAAYERGRMVGRAEGYNSGYSAKAAETEPEDDTSTGDAPTAG